MWPEKPKDLTAKDAENSRGGRENNLTAKGAKTAREGRKEKQRQLTTGDTEGHWEVRSCGLTHRKESQKSCTAEVAEKKLLTAKGTEKNLRYGSRARTTQSIR